MSSTEPTLGDIVADRYRLDKELGRGGFSVVYKANQLALDRPVALKMLLPGSSWSEVNLGLFEREAGLTKEMQHPHIVEIFDFGRTPEGWPWLVMELLEGESLKGRLKKRPLGEDALGIFARDVLAALMESHQEGVVHRDIKPSNIFLCDYAGEPDFAVLLDFGIAGAVQQLTNDPLIPEGAVLGTPMYIAPEQVRGDAVGPHTDLYAFGLVLAEALTGQAVFPKDIDPIQMLREQASLEPVPLPPEVLQSRWGGIIERATRKDLRQRYLSARQMLADVERVLRGERLSRGDLSLAAAGTPLSLPELGTVVGERFRLEEVMGEKTFGVVFRATQLSLERKVALKMLLPDNADAPEPLAYFRAEVQAVASLYSPHTVRILDWGEHDGRLPWLAMEWLHGIPLREMMAWERLDSRDVLQIGLQVLDSLCEAHDRGFIHGNLKPSNIFIAKDPFGELFVRVSDFAFIRRFVGSGDAAVQTGEGHIVGSPRYMAPEVLRDENQGPWTDLYALGLILAEALAGQPIFPWDLEPLEVARHQMSKRSVSLPTVARSGALGQAIEKATQKKPKRRYRSAREMFAVLHRG